MEITNVFNIETEELTEYGKYAFFSRAKYLFAQYLKEKGEVGKQFYSSVKSKMDVPETVKEELYNKFATVIENYNDFVKDIPNKYPQWYETKEQVASIKDYIEDFELPEDISLEDAFAGYKWASQELKNIDRSKLPMIEVRKILSEFQEDYNNLKSEYAVNIGYDEYEKELEESKVSMDVESKRLKTNRKILEEKPPIIDVIQSKYTDYLKSK